MTKHETFNFTGFESFNIFCQTWHPEAEPSAVLLIVHGYAEHSGRYQHVAEHFAELGYAIYALDHRGHGQSDGVRADVVYFEDYLTDLKTFLNLVKEREPGRRVFLLGHSMGGAIATLFAARHGSDFDGLITSGAGVKIEGNAPPWLIHVSKIIATLAPRLPMIPFDNAGVSRDPEVITRYRNDPLNYLGKVRARWGFQVLRGAGLCESVGFSMIGKTPIMTWL